MGGRITESGRLGAFITKVKKGSLADVVGHLRAGSLNIHTSQMVFGTIFCLYPIYLSTNLYVWNKWANIGSCLRTHLLYEMAEKQKSFRVMTHQAHIFGTSQTPIGGFPANSTCLIGGGRPL